MSPELSALIVALVVAVLRELLRAWEIRLRRRGELRTRHPDDTNGGTEGEERSVL